jgi:hypothetical protein
MHRGAAFGWGLVVMTRKDPGFGAAWRAVRWWGTGELAISSAKRFRWPRC